MEDVPDQDSATNPEKVYVAYPSNPGHGPLQYLAHSFMCLGSAKAMECNNRSTEQLQLASTTSSNYDSPSQASEPGVQILGERGTMTQEELQREAAAQI